mgnify:CR=1 FL=1
MFNYVKNSLSKLIKSRLIVLVVLFALLAGILIQRLYTMQIINGEKYLTDFTEADHMKCASTYADEVEYHDIMGLSDQKRNNTEKYAGQYL